MTVRRFPNCLANLQGRRGRRRHQGCLAIFQGASCKRLCNNACQAGKNLACKICELFCPLQSPGSPRGGNPQKMGKKYKIPLPGPTPEKGENYRKFTKKMYFRSIFCNFSVIFPHFRGLDRGGGFCIFVPIFRGFPPRGLPGLCEGKNNSQCKIQKVEHSR